MPTTLWRVLPYAAKARLGQPGHPLYVPPRQGAGRLDNPEHYLVRYFADHPSGAVAESFGDLATWSPSMLRGSPSLPGSVRAIATYELALGTALCDLDDPTELVARALRPSHVVSRDHASTQAWALRIWIDARYDGVRWWSYRDPRWGSIGIWSTASLTVTDVQPLTITHPAVTAAAVVMNRPL
jgi:hypothetical protein